MTAIRHVLIRGVSYRSTQRFRQYTAKSALEAREFGARRVSRRVYVNVSPNCAIARAKMRIMTRILKSSGAIAALATIINLIPCLDQNAAAQAPAAPPAQGPAAVGAGQGGRGQGGRGAGPSKKPSA